jgi:hypothetical protein
VSILFAVFTVSMAFVFLAFATAEEGPNDQG